MRIYRRGFLAAAAVVLALSGCAAGPADSAEVASTSTPTPDAVAGPSIAVLTVGGSGVTAIDENGQEVSSLDYTSDGATAVAYLTAVFGSEPVVTVRTSDMSCHAEASRATWGAGAVELLYDFIGEKTGLPDGQYVSLTVKAESVGTVGIETPTGFSVGDAESNLITSIPGVVTDVNAADPNLIYVDYELIGGVYVDPVYPVFGEDEVGAWGAKAASSSSVIVQLDAPVTFQDFC
jgi:hypothetical protein